MIDKKEAEKILREAAAEAEKPVDKETSEPTYRKLSETCKTENKTHIAFMATALLAKASDVTLDVRAVKAKTGGANAYSARGLCHGVIVPLSAELGIDLGVTGREPLNNQPYFRIDTVTRDAPVRESAKVALNQVCDILDTLAAMTSKQAKDELTCFLRVRKEFARSYAALENGEDHLRAEELANRITELVAAKSEGGRRAQAVVAALMDVFAGEDRVEADKINDPDRHTPGDVGVKAANGAWERLFEVRDKPVTKSDLYSFAKKVLDNGGERASVIAVAQDDVPDDASEAIEWAAERGLDLQIYIGWQNFVREVLTWCPLPTFRAAAAVTPRVYARLIEQEAEPAAVDFWNELCAGLPEAEEPQQKLGLEI